MLRDFANQSSDLNEFLPSYVFSETGKAKAQWFSEKKYYIKAMIRLGHFYQCCILFKFVSVQDFSVIYFGLYVDNRGNREQLHT